MNLRVLGGASPGPFLGARDLFTTEYDLDLPVEVQVESDPDERTRASHHPDRHVLTISQTAATGAMARELTLHEFAHMYRHETRHPSHVQPTEEAIYLALAGRSIERHKLIHCYQIANHMKDIYADDLTLDVAPAEKLVAYLESRLAAAVLDRPVDPPSGRGRATRGADPEITVVNAAFALALVERHDLVDDDHRLYDLAHAAAQDAPALSLDAFRHRFRTLAAEPDRSEYRKALVDVTREYTGGTRQAAD